MAAQGAVHGKKLQDENIFGILINRMTASQNSSTLATSIYSHILLFNASIFPPLFQSIPFFLQYMNLKNYREVSDWERMGLCRTTPAAPLSKHSQLTWWWKRKMHFPVLYRHFWYFLIDIRRGSCSTSIHEGLI